MKKKELKELPEMLVTPAIRNAERADQPTARDNGWGGKVVEVEYPRFYRAAVHGDILQVAIFTHDTVRSGERPLYTVFVDKKDGEHATLTKDGKWRKGKIDSLEVDNSTWRCTQKEWSSSKERKLVNEYFRNKENKNIYQAVLDWQRDQGAMALRRRWNSEIEKIDETMKEVPAEPKDLREWIRNHAFDENVFYMKNKKTAIGYCTHCHNWVDITPAIRHGEVGKCPRCHHSVTWRSWKRQQTIEDEQYVGVLQKLTDDSGYILRGYKCRIMWTLDNEWNDTQLWIHEEYRSRLSRQFAEQEFFEWGEWKYTGINRWCHQLQHGFYGAYTRFGKAHMYTRNLKKELKSEAFCNVNVARLFDYGRSYRGPVDILQKLYRHPYFEYLQKAGLNKLADEIMKGIEYSQCLDSSKTRLHEVLKLDKQRYNRLREWNGGCRALYLLQLEQCYGGKVTKDLAEWAEGERILGLETLLRRTGLNPVQQLNYLRRQMKIGGMSYHNTEDTYSDFLDMAEARGMDITDDIVRRQKNMREYHDRYAEERNAEKNRERDKTVNQRFAEIAKEYEQNAEHFAFETKDLIVSVPRRASDITIEGRRQHHCVGASDTYLERMNTGKSFIIFLRHKNNQKTPYYTIEIEWTGNVKQWYGAYDRKPDEEKIEKVIKRLQKKVASRCPTAPTEPVDVQVIQYAV